MDELIEFRKCGYCGGAFINHACPTTGCPQNGIKGVGLRTFSHLICIDQYISEYGWPPTQREISERMGNSMTSTQRAIHKLVMGELLKTRPRDNRAIAVTPFGRAMLAEYREFRTPAGGSDAE